MTREEAKLKIDELCDKLNFFSYKYYVENESPVSDYEYDMLQRELKTLEEQYPEFVRADSPNLRVGGEAENTFEPVHHEVKLESLQDAFSYEEIDDFNRRVTDTVRECTYVVEPKIDGLSVSLQYKNGIFTRGATRGDGNVGEDTFLGLCQVQGDLLAVSLGRAFHLGHGSHVKYHQLGSCGGIDVPLGAVNGVVVGTKDHAYVSGLGFFGHLLSVRVNVSRKTLKRLFFFQTRHCRT